MESLKFSGLRYGQLLQDLTAELGAGQRVGLTGPNGCGKTTLLRLLAGWLPWEAGEFSIAGQNQLDLPPERRQLALLPTQAALYSHWNVQENIRFPARSLGVGDQSQGLMEELQLSGLAQRKPDQLSQGERQRVAWARVLNRPAPWLLADEALAHLDGPQRQQLWTTLNRRWAGGLLLVTHQLQQDLAWLDQLYCLERGRLVRVNLNRLEQNPGSSWLAGQLRPENVWPGQLLGWATGDWWVPPQAWKDDPQGLPAHWLEQRGQLWKVEVQGRVIWLARSQRGENLRPDPEISAFLEASPPC
ncbi:ATP-binding cassette domain-containing protein [bacterium]|nr:ATP-binding cassette domain-containing protein [bacterium]